MSDNIKRINICNVLIDNISFQNALERIDGFISKRDNIYVVTPNVDHIVKLQKNEEFRRIYSGASLVLTDGVPVIWASKFLGTPLKEKISGVDLFVKLCAKAAEKNTNYFF